MSVCRLALEAYRLEQFPMEGTDKQDLDFAVRSAEGWIEEGLETFPHDSDIRLDNFIDWANEVKEPG